MENNAPIEDNNISYCGVVKPIASLLKNNTLRYMVLDFLSRQRPPRPHRMLTTSEIARGIGRSHTATINALHRLARYFEVEAFVIWQSKKGRIMRYAWEITKNGRRILAMYRDRVRIGERIGQPVSLMLTRELAPAVKRLDDFLRRNEHFDRREINDLAAYRERKRREWFERHPDDLPRFEEAMRHGGLANKKFNKFMKNIDEAY